MLNHKQEKLENPARLAELNPSMTLKRVGLADGDTVCDIGAGSGIFALPAARQTRGFVYAIDPNSELLQITSDRARTEGLSNIKIIQTATFKYEIPADTVDLVLLVAVLHEIERKADLLREIRRILKPSGRLCVIEFRKEPTPFGPPVDHRIGIDEVIAVCGDSGFSERERFFLGENHYCSVLRKADR